MYVYLSILPLFIYIYAYIYIYICIYHVSPPPARSLRAEAPTLWNEDAKCQTIMSYHIMLYQIR